MFCSQGTVWLPGVIHKTGSMFLAASAISEGTVGVTSTRRLDLLCGWVLLFGEDIKGLMQ